MKKIAKFAGYASIVLTICLLLGATSVLAGGSFDGLSNKEINKKLMDDMMKETEGVNIYDFDKGELKVQEIAKESGFHRNQITELLGKGYTEEEINTMDLDKVDAILTEGMDYDEMLMYYTHVASRPFSEYVDKFPEGYFTDQNTRGLVYCDICGYSHSDLVDWTHITATEGYNGDGCFHEDSQLTQSNINTACYRSKLCGFNIFDLTSSTYLNFDYHIFGEDMSPEYPHWAHEGVDINYTGANGRDVYAPISGDLVRLSSSTVLIYPTSGSYTVNVQHLDNAIADGLVTKGVTKIGDEGVGSGENHIHIGVCTDNGAECTEIHSGRDEEIILECVPPYTYID